VRECHCRIRQKSLHSETTPGRKNLACPALGDKSNNYMPLLHIKLGLIEIFVKVIDKEREGFAFLRQKFPRINEAKIKAGIFFGPQMKHPF